MGRFMMYTFCNQFCVALAECDVSHNQFRVSLAQCDSVS